MIEFFSSKKNLPYRKLDVKEKDSSLAFSSDRCF